MSIALRLLLLIASIFTFLYIVRKLRKSQLQVMDTVFWIVLATILIVLSIFPQIAYWIANILGIQSPVNFIFLLIIFMVMIRNFLLTIKVSQLEDKLKTLVEELAIRENASRKKDM
ncbi:DUF2304 domain-containing protein [Lachnospira multipara]|uniref:DUF2304 domain-containing protein n=1 Tax=Lachnospira multipara TaxID=28051 RepID=UPI000488D943|nr:DUF2304 domain-containing protein [Lachnospira multipara]